VSTPTASVGLSHRQILVVFSGLMLGMLLAALDQTIVATALPTIVGDLGGLDQLSWVVTAYLLTTTATTPLYGKISDLYGRKLVFQAAIVIFLAGSVLSGVAQSMGQLIAFRAVQGAGAGGLMVLAMAIIGDILSPRERGRYQGYLGAVFALASIGGPLLGGLFTDHLSWRWVFYINLPIGIVALVVTSAVLDLPFERTPHRVDYRGAALLIGSVTSLLLVTVWGGTEYAWGSPVIVGLAVAGIVLGVAFAFQEHRAVEPILPLRLFGNGVFNVTGAAGFLLGVAMFGTIVFLPLFLQVVTGVSATNSGLLLVPLMFGVITSSILSGRLITRTGRYKRFPIAGTILITVGLWLFSTMDATTSRPTVFAYMVVVGLGFGLIMQVLVLAVQNAVEQRDLGTATSAANFFRQLGGSFGVAIFGAIFNNALGERLIALAPVTGGIDASVVQNSPEQIRALPSSTQAALVDAFSGALHTVFLWAVPIGVVAFLAVLLLQELPLREHAYVGGSLEGAGEELAVTFEPVSDPEHPIVLSDGHEAGGLLSDDHPDVDTPSG